MTRYHVVLMFTGVLSVGVLGCDDDNPVGPSEGITVYEDSGFGGAAQRFDDDEMDLDDVFGPCDGDDWDDCISSIRIPDDWEVTVFEDDDYDGVSATFTSDVSDLDDVFGPCDDGWDDCISSMRVRER